MNRILTSIFFFCVCAYASAEDIHKKQHEAHFQRVKTIGVKKLTALAEKGDANAQFDLGWLYNYGGAGVEKDLKQSFLWHKKSAEQGHVEAQAHLAACYYWERGVKSNYEEAFKWFSKAAKSNKSPYSEGILGGMYLSGFGTKKDPVEALKWYRKSAAANRSEWLNGLAYMYRNGVGVEKDPVVAVSLYTFSIEQGYGNYNYPDHAIQLGEMYEKGEGVDKNLKKAVSMYIKAYEMAEAIGNKDLKERAKQMLDKAKSN